MFTNILVIFLLVPNVYGSLGDRLVIYQNLLQSCLRKNCPNQNAQRAFELNQPIYLKFFGWDCTAECKFQSQWSTLAELKRNNVHKIPQFYGKWPFYRFFGIQEPASFLFSLLNLFSNFYCWIRYQKKANVKDDPLYQVWRIQTFVTMNAWFWSTIYHSRDTFLSEKLDYFSAYSVIIFSLCAIVCKFLSEYEYRQFMYISVSLPMIAFYLYHTHYLHFVHFDYGYNLRINILTGFLSTICWMYWCFIHRKSRKHVWKCFASLLCVNLGLLLELLDFPPLVFVIDAHSLWHLWTFPLPFLWFNFLEEEAIYVAQNTDFQKKLHVA